MRTAARPPFLALDTGSSQPSVALGGSGFRSRVRSAPPRACSERLLGLVDEVLVEAGLTPADLGGVIVLRGPGSFTGLRVGLATALGLHLGLGVPVAAVGTLEVLAEAGFERSATQRCLAMVDALRDHWYVAAFGRNRPREPLSPPRRATRDELLAEVEAQRIGCLSGFSADRLAFAAGFAGDVVVPSALATVALRLAERHGEWDPALVTRPLYLMSPAATPAGEPAGAGR
jgi:tRNA threonylcarbamoyladenosine biosynthesis protein TsaB